MSSLLQGLSKHLNLVNHWYYKIATSAATMVHRLINNCLLRQSDSTGGSIGGIRGDDRRGTASIHILLGVVGIPLLCFV